MQTLLNKNIIIGVTGGIAAYKSAELIRHLQEASATVRVVMTRAAEAFITPLTLQALSGNPVHRDLFDPAAEAAMGHIQLARWADIILIAPASADFIAKLAHGHGDNLLSTLCLATRAQLCIAPAMNQQMWHHVATQQNLQILAERDVQQFGPDVGEQACGDVGPGRMLAPQDMADGLAALFVVGGLAGKTVVITAGPTQEAIDPVRFISNHSSGKMGYALAEAAVAAGAKVKLISGPTQLSCPEHVECTSVISAQQMYSAAIDQVQAACDIFIAAAAVTDFRCDTIAGQKIKKSQVEQVLNLTQNPDIVATVANLKSRPVTIGFAAETENIIDNAKQKLISKNLDMIIANQVDAEGMGFAADENEVTVISANEAHHLPLARKQLLAREIMKLITHYVEKKHDAKKTNST
ncbi:MAG: bifunctional phosphopantothenoylcysteine decarboxylase/phosphopantothenate--cysteine ligase CoaBC [Gammaproteobacteria bacterium]